MTLTDSATFDEFTGYEERPMSEAPLIGVVLAKSKNGETYMKVEKAASGAWCLAGTSEATLPLPHTWLKPPEKDANNDTH